MAVVGDLRKKPLRGRTFIYCEIDNSEHYPPLVLIILHAKPPKTKNSVIRLHRDSIKKLKRMSAWKQGLTVISQFRRKQWNIS